MGERKGRLFEAQVAWSRSVKQETGDTFLLQKKKRPLLAHICAQSARCISQLLPLSNLILRSAAARPIADWHSLMTSTVQARRNCGAREQ